MRVSRIKQQERERERVGQRMRMYSVRDFLQGTEIKRERNTVIALRESERFIVYI